MSPKDKDKKAAALRDAWDKAVEKDRPKDALAALEGLEQLEPKEPRWAQRRGEVLRRLGRAKDAEAAFSRAMALYVEQGFLPRAVAVAKIIVQLNPSRASILGELDAGAARELRRAAKAPSIAPPKPAHKDLTPFAVLRSPPRAAEKPPSEVAAASPVAAPARIASAPPVARPSRIAGVPAHSVRLVASSLSLEPAKDAERDEVRFENVPDELAMALDLTDLDLEPAASGARAPSAERLSQMTAAGLFVDVPSDALASLARAAELLELAAGARVFARGDVADALYVIVEGTARVAIAAATGGVDLAEGQVFGEACLLERGTRQADVSAKTRLVALRIAKGALDEIVAAHPPVGDVLFELLLQRLVANTLQTSELFAAFDSATQRELARLFEVRRAPAGVLVIELGKRSDGLYLALAGDLEVDDALGTREVPLGSMFGQESLLSAVPARRTVRAITESVLLRLPAKRFGSFAAQYPPALAHLSELASRPLGT